MRPALKSMQITRQGRGDLRMAKFITRQVWLSCTVGLVRPIAPNNQHKEPAARSFIKDPLLAESWLTRPTWNVTFKCCAFRCRPNSFATQGSRCWLHVWHKSTKRASCKANISGLPLSHRPSSLTTPLPSCVHGLPFSRSKHQQSKEQRSSWCLPGMARPRRPPSAAHPPGRGKPGPAFR